jgi:hypothetical protein
MTEQTAADDATVPIHDDLIDDAALMYELDAEAVREYLAAANERWLRFEAELKEHDEIVEDTDERLVVLVSDDGVRAVEKRAYDAVDIDIPDRHGSRLNLLGELHDKHAKQYAADAFGGRDAATQCGRSGRRDYRLPRVTTRPTRERRRQSGSTPDAGSMAPSHTTDDDGGRRRDARATRRRVATQSLRR